jgi:hypothetical protein
LVYVGLGDHDQAMIWLNKAYEARFNPSILLRPPVLTLCAPTHDSWICGAA